MPLVKEQLRIEDVRGIVVKAALDEKDGSLVAVITMRARMDPLEIGALLGYVKRSSISAIQVESLQMTLPMEPKAERAEQPPLPEGAEVEAPEDADAFLGDEEADTIVAAALADATLSLVRGMDQPQPYAATVIMPAPEVSFGHPGFARPPKKHVNTETGEITEAVA